MSFGVVAFFFFFLRGNAQGGQIQASNQSGADRFCLLLFWEGEEATVAKWGG